MAGALAAWITWATWEALEEETWEDGCQVRSEVSSCSHCCSGWSEVTFLLSSDMYRSGMGGMDRDFGHNDMPMNRGFGDSFGMGESF